MKINIKSSPPEIWIRTRFLEINGSPSLVTKQAQESIYIEGNYKYLRLENLKLLSEEIDFKSICKSP